MEETKYYTPAPEDIRIGFYCERRYCIGGGIFSDGFSFGMVSNWIEIHNILNQLKKGEDTIRVPYLTAEQIEAEGWKVTSSSESGRQFEAHLIRDQKIKLYTYNGPANQLIVYHSQTMVFRGICRCINDLRTVSKLLGI